MLIRDALASDAQAIARVQVLSWQSTYRGIIAQPTLAALSGERLTRSWLHQLFSLPTGSLCRVVVNDTGGVTGYAMGSRARGLPDQKYGVAEIQVLYLQPDTCRRGDGRRLITAMARGLDRLGYRQLHIWCLAENPSRPFYDRLGGRVGATRATILCGQSLQEVRYEWPALVDLIREPQAVGSGGSHDSL